MRFIAFWSYHLDGSKNTIVMAFEAETGEEASEKVLKEQQRTSTGAGETIFVAPIGEGRVNLAENLRELLRNDEVVLRIPADRPRRNSFVTKVAPHRDYIHH